MFYVMFVGVDGLLKNSNALFVKQKQDQKHLKELFFYNKIFLFLNIIINIKLNVYIINKIINIKDKYI